MKKILTVIFASLLCFSLFYTSYAATAIDNITGSGEGFIILATITGVDDSVFVLSKEYVISPKENNLPSEISVEKFRYSYCSEHAESYNNPQIGDNIIVNITYSNGKYYVGGAYKVDTVSYKTLKVLVPLEMKGQPCSSELLALAYYIRSDGTKTDYKYENGNVYALPQTLINDYENDYITYYSNASMHNSDDVIKDVTLENLLRTERVWIPVTAVVSFLLIAGVFIIFAINRSIIKKQ